MTSRELQDLVSDRFTRLGIEVIREEGKFVVLLDPEFGEYRVQRSKLLRDPNSGRCWERYQKERGSIKTAEEVQERINRIFDFGLKIDPETFTGTHRKARFIDPEYGEFWQKPNNTIHLKQGHPLRGRDKRKQTNIEKYGVENQMQREQVKLTVLSQRREISEKRRETFISRHGADCWMKTEEGKKNYREKARKNPDKWVKTEEGWQPKEKLWKVRKKPGLKRFCEENEIPYSTAVSLANRGLSVEEIAQHRKEGQTTLENFFLAKIGGTKNYERFGSATPDIKISDNIFVECDGLFWHSENKKHQPQRHIGRRKLLEEHGKTLLQFREHEILFQSDIVRSIVAAKLGQCQKVFARQLSVSCLSRVEAEKFFQENHLMGFMRGVRSFGLVREDGTLMSAISVRKRGEELIVERFASKCGWSVTGGLSRLLKRSVESYSGVTKITSWVDRRYADGHSLITLGFSKEKTVLSWQWTDFKKTYNRLHCRAGMDERGLSEKQHAAELGLVRIYDAGQSKYTKTLKI